MKVCLLIFLFIASLRSFAQVGDIIGGIGDVSGAAEGCSESCGDACVEGCFTGIYLNCTNWIQFEGLFAGIAAAQRSLLDKKNRVSRIHSLDILYQYGITWDVSDSSFSPKYNSALNVPALRYNWGLFGLEYRFDRYSDKTGWIHNNDVQLLFNAAQQENANFRLGLGASLLEGERLSPDRLFVSYAYSLLSTGLDVYILNERLCPSLDLRVTTDGQTFQRIEMNSRVGYKIYRSGHLDFIVDAGYNFRRYNLKLNRHTFTIGLRINIH